MATQLNLLPAYQLGDVVTVDYELRGVDLPPLTFAAKACLRDGALRWYPMGFPRNARTIAVNGADGFATPAEALRWHTAELDAAYTMAVPS